MTYSDEPDCISEKVSPIFDKDNREYYLNIKYFNHDDFQSINLHLIRCKRESRVAKAFCSLTNTGELLISDIEVNNNLEFESWGDKFFKLTHWNEPVNYQKNGLGSYLLKTIIKIAKTKKARKIYGSVTKSDLAANSNLINWYKKYGFKIEPPTGNETCDAAHRICLYLD